MSKQTAVEFLVEQITNGTMPARKAIEQAKALERWQIEQAYDKGNSDAFHGKHKKENYYNETYKGGSNE